MMFNKLYEKRLHQNKRDDYVYDSLYRLTEQRKDADLNGNSPLTTVNYALDGVGNRTTVTTNGTPQNYTTNNLNQYTQINGTAQLYDDNGNLKSDGTNNYCYDYANRLVRADTPTITVNYKYDVFGRRIEKSTVASTTRYYYEGARTIEDTDNLGNTTATYVFGNGIDEVLTMERSGQTYYYHTNTLGSVTEITDPNGNIVERYEYDVYGKVTIYTSSGVDGIWNTADDTISTTSAIGNRYLYTGREYEEETGLYYYRARFYDPNTGRFLQRDIIGYDKLINLYTYVSNSPAVYVDPKGWDEELERIMKLPEDTESNVLLKIRYLEQKMKKMSWYEFGEFGKAFSQYGRLKRSVDLAEELTSLYKGSGLAAEKMDKIRGVAYNIAIKYYKEIEEHITNKLKELYPTDVFAPTTYSNILDRLNCQNYAEIVRKWFVDNNFSYFRVSIIRKEYNILGATVTAHSAVVITKEDEEDPSEKIKRDEGIVTDAWRPLGEVKPTHNPAKEFGGRGDRIFIGTGGEKKFILER